MGVGLISCSESTVDADGSRLGWNYYPVELGLYRVYQVEETNYALVGSETSVYQLRESMVDTSNIGSEIRIVLNRESRLDANDEWQLDSVWTARIDPNRLIVTENNVPFVKLTFPIVNETIWDGNSSNTRNFDDYRTDNTLKDTVLYEQPYSDLWTVVQSDLGEDILGRNDRSEIYAPDVGLLIKNVVIWNYCQMDCSSEKQIVAGRELSQTLIEYGNLLSENE